MDNKLEMLNTNLLIKMSMRVNSEIEKEMDKVK